MVQIKEVQDVVRSLYESRQSRGKVEVYLRLVSNCANGIINKAAKNRSNFNLDSCYDVADASFLRELEVFRVVSISDYYDKDAEGEYTSDGIFDYALVTINDPIYIQSLNGWVNDLPNILNYGIFSLNTITGEAYCLDNGDTFLPYSGMFRVLKAFLNESSHCLSYENIYRVFRDEKDPDLSRMTPEAIHQIIGDIREKLSMKGKLSKLFVSSSNQYVLRPTLD